MAAAVAMLVFLLLPLVVDTSSAFSFVSAASSKRKNEASPAAGQPVTYGSAISIRHVDSQFYLFSAKISWGSGSGQQAVTAMPATGSEIDASLLWLVREAPQMTPHAAGEPVKCDDFIRLEHATSNRNLHSHEMASPVSQQYEVSAFGEDGEGDEGDTFQLVCPAGAVWKVGEAVRFRHFYTGGYVTASKQKRFSRDNCPRCPIQGHLEVAVTKGGSKQGSSSLWRAEDGALVSHELGEDSPKPGSPGHPSADGKVESSSESSVDEEL